MRKQNGVAILTICVFIVGLIGLLYLSIESGRFFVEKQRLDMVADSAALHLASIDNDNVNLHGNKIVSSIFEISENDSGSFQSQYRFKVDKSNSSGKSVNINYSKKFNSWFNNEDNDYGFDKVVPITSRSGAEFSISGDLDIVFVVDYSGSMSDVWKGNGDGKTKRIDYLRKAMNRLIPEIIEFGEKNGNKVRIGIVPFDFYAWHPTKVDSRAEKGARCPVNAYEADEKKFNAAKTMENLWDYKSDRCIAFLAAKSTKQTVELTDDKSVLEASMEWNNPYDGTASLQGIIYGAQMLNESSETDFKVLLIIGDGEDSEYTQGLDSKKQFSILLKKHKICEKIRNKISTSSSKFTLAAVGLDYDVKKNTNLVDCVGNNNLYKATSGNDIYKQIISLIGNRPPRLN